MKYVRSIAGYDKDRNQTTRVDLYCSGELTLEEVELAKKQQIERLRHECPAAFEKPRKTMWQYIAEGFASSRATGS